MTEVKDEYGVTYKATLSSCQRIDTRDKLNSVINCHPKAILFSKQCSNLKADQARELIDNHKSVYFAITILMLKKRKTRFKQFTDWLASHV